MIVYSNSWFNVVQKGKSFFVDEPSSRNGAAIIPLKANRLVLLKMRRPSQGGDVTLEIPRGYGEPKETSAECALRELYEETGYLLEPTQIQKLGYIRPNTGILSSRVPIYLGRIPEGASADQHGAETERLVTLPLSELRSVLAEGRVEDGFTLSALTLLVAHGNADV